jgi:hypothetical protein
VLCCLFRMEYRAYEDYLALSASTHHYRMLKKWGSVDRQGVYGLMGHVQRNRDVENLLVLLPPAGVPHSSAQKGCVRFPPKERKEEADRAENARMGEGLTSVAASG